MKKKRRVVSLMVIFLLAAALPTRADVSNLLVNGMASGAVSTPGETVTWQYDLSVGGTAKVEFWVDVDTNKVLDPAFDFRLFQFTQTDNGPAEDAPPDMDGTTNGQIFVQMPHGLAPAWYFMIAEENGVADTADFKIVPMENPPFTVFGSVKDETGKGVPWIMVAAYNDDDNVMPDFWHAFTDEMGNYVIAMDSSAYGAQQPWHIEVDTEYRPDLVVAGPDTFITLSGDHGPIDFVVVQPTMYIAGTVLDQNGQPLQGEVGVWAWSNQLNQNMNTEVGPNGQFVIGFGDFAVGDWEVGVWSPAFPDQYLEPIPTRVTLSGPGDSLIVEFRVYAVDDTIWGKLEAEGDPIVGGREVAAEAQGYGRSIGSTDPNGFFALPVSSAAAQYQIMLWNDSWEIFQQAGFQQVTPGPIMAAPGDTVVYQFTRTILPTGDFTINGQTWGAKITQGDTVQWHYTLPPGATAHVVVWFDMDQNGALDPMMDARVTEFDQTDNGPADNGPPDMDGATNGEIFTSVAVGFAPGHYFVEVFKDNGNAQSDFTVVPIQNPQYSVFGQVVDISGQGLPGVLVVMESDDPTVQPDFWQAITDHEGNFFIGMNASVTGASQPWHLRVAEQFAMGRKFVPEDVTLEISGQHGPIIFQEQEQAAYVVGRVLDEQGQPLPFPVGVSAERLEAPEMMNSTVQPDGHFSFQFPPHSFGRWRFMVAAEPWNFDFLQPVPSEFDIMQVGDTVFVDLVVFAANDTIWGELVGLPESLLPELVVVAKNDSVGMTMAKADASGHFLLRVSGRAPQYDLMFEPESYAQVVQAGFYVLESLPFMAFRKDTVRFHFSNEAVSLGNLLLNGQKNGSQTVSGTEFEWRYQLPVGSEVFVQVWYDKNGDQQLSPATDILMVQFSQRDGDLETFGPPPDMDGVMNGQVYTRFPQGLAPGVYFLRIFNDTDADTGSFEILPIQQPAYSIFGSVVNEDGQGVPWVFVEANPENWEMAHKGPSFWMAITDAAGNYTINMDTTIGQPPVPFRLKLNESSVGAFVVQESEYHLTVDNQHGPFDFHLLRPRMVIKGELKDEKGQPLFGEFEVSAWSERLQLDRHSTVDSAGQFMIYFAEADTGTWKLHVWGPRIGSEFMRPFIPDAMLSQVGDTANISITLYRADTLIVGRIVADGDPIVGGQQIMAVSEITGSSETYTDHEGYFEIRVSRRAPEYRIELDWQFLDALYRAGFQPTSPMPFVAAPGDTVTISFSRWSDVSSENTTPSEFGLLQNYPNPFAPQLTQSTRVEFAVTKKANVKIAVYNLLGQRVAELLNSEIQAGRHAVIWDGRTMNGELAPAGVYFIRMQAEGIVQNKKLLIVR